MTETGDHSEEVPVYAVSDLPSTARAVVNLFTHEAIIVDFRAVDDAELGRVGAMLQGAGLAHGNSPFHIADRVFFLTKGRAPGRREWERFGG
jgi:hypothetical protein